MTPPRQILPDQNFEVTTRTFARTFRLLPRSDINQLVLYVLGLAAQRYGIVLYGLVVMITHYHLKGRDVRGRLPEFQRLLNSLIARALNARQGLDDKLWSGDGYHLVRPQSADDIRARMGYILANPVAADLVNRAQDYPGVLILPKDIGRTLVVNRPTFFFPEDSKLPERVELCFEVPPEFAHMGRDGYVAMLEADLRERERVLREERKAEGRTVLGPDRCRQARLGDQSKSKEQWFRLRPVIAAKVKSERCAAIKALCSFRARYREALAQWREGRRDVLFPPGTWWMCHFAGAAVG